MSGKKPTPVEDWKVTKNPRGTYPRTVSYTVDPIEGEYTFDVLLLGAFKDTPTCVQHGDTCDHAKAVELFRAKKGKKR